MTLCTAAPTQAQRQAESNLAANLAALRPSAVVPNQITTSNGEWVYGRDGSLTLMDAQGAWTAGCSVPRLAAREILRQVQSGHAIFAHPTHPAQIEVALSLLQPENMLIALLPDAQSLALALHCRDFSEAIRSHRLWFIAGNDWPDQLMHLFERHPGLPIPQQILNTLGAENPLIAPVQRTLASIARGRAMLHERMLAEARSARPKPGRICILAGSRFRLWDDAQLILADLLASQSTYEFCRVDPDDPLQASRTALLAESMDCSAIVTANLARADLGQAIPDRTPLISWITTPRIPPFAATPAGDYLLLADPSWLALARSAGWPADRLEVAGWPSFPGCESVTPEPILGIIADTVISNSLDFALSSHRALAESVRNQIQRDCFAAAEFDGYLRAQMRTAGIQEEGFERQRFIDQIIVPAYQQALARVLIAAGLPVRIHGRGWDQIAEFRPYSSGPIHSRAELLRASSACRALVNVWPGATAHPIQSLGRAVVPRCLSRDAFVRQASAALQSQLPWAAPANPLSAQQVLRLIERLARS